MQSPFEYFRKNQKMMMVILIGMAMFAFVLMDPLMNLSRIPPWISVVLLAVVGGGIAWAVGMQTNKTKQSEYALTGLLIGVAIGVAIWMFNRPTAAVETTAGNLTEKDLRDMMLRRQQAVKFMRDCYDAAVARPPQPRIPLQTLQQLGMSDFTRPYWTEHQRFNVWYEMRRYAAFGFHENQRMTDEDLVDKFLLLQEAKELGIEVSNEAVVAYIHRMAKGITKKAYLNIRKELKLSEPELFDILREEIAIQQVFRARRPSQFTPPSQYWQMYHQLNVKQNMEVVAVPTQAFLSQVAEPTDKDLQKLFEEYKEKPPTGEPSPNPAFAFPERVQIAYFQANKAAVEKDVSKKLEKEFLTPGEIESALKRIDDEIADVEKRIADKQIKEELADKERLNAKREDLRALLTSGGKINRLDYEIVLYYELHKQDEFANPTWSDPFPKGDPSKKDPFLNFDDPVEAPKPKSAPKTPAEKTPAPKKTSAVNSLRHAGALAKLALVPALSVALFQPEAPGKQPPVKTAAKAKSTAQQPPAPPLPENPKPSPFQPLTDDLKVQIRGKVLPNFVMKEIRNRLQKAATAMEKYSTRWLNRTEEGGEEFDPTAVSNDLRKKAEEWGLEYVMTEPISELEFIDSAAYPMSRARQIFDLSETAMRMQPGPFLNQVLFRLDGEGPRESRPKRLYSVIRAETTGSRGFGADNLFVLWKTAHLNARVPEFADKGVRERVLAAWKNINARPLAEKRAEELKKVIADSAKPMSIALAGKTVTGKPDDAKLIPDRTPRPVSWLTRDPIAADSSVPPLGTDMMTGRPTLMASRIPGTENIGDDFRRTVFEELKDGELGVVSNVDRSVYYVVRVMDRTPTTAAGRQEHMNQLLDDDPMSNSPPYDMVRQKAESEARKLQQEVLQQLRDKYQVKLRKKTNE